MSVTLLTAFSSNSIMIDIHKLNNLTSEKCLLSGDIRKFFWRLWCKWSLTLMLTTSLVSRNYVYWVIVCLAGSRFTQNLINAFNLYRHCSNKSIWRKKEGSERMHKNSEHNARSLQCAHYSGSHNKQKHNAARVDRKYKARWRLFTRQNSCIKRNKIVRAHIAAIKMK